MVASAVGGVLAGSAAALIVGPSSRAVSGNYRSASDPGRQILMKPDYTFIAGPVKGTYSVTGDLISFDLSNQQKQQARMSGDLLFVSQEVGQNKGSIVPGPYALAAFDRSSCAGMSVCKGMGNCTTKTSDH
jgi:hypothetical protein